MKVNKILILVPAATARGGITNYYQVLRQEFGSDVEYFERGARTWPIKDNKIKEAYRIVTDYIDFIRRLLKKDISLVQSTTSLSMATTIRDGVFLRIAQLFGAKTIVFFRGWEESAERRIEKSIRVFRFFFFSSTAMIALSERVKCCLKRWGYTNSIYLETTLYDKYLTKGVELTNLKNKYLPSNLNKPINLLYLSRVEQRKGIFELIDAYAMLCNIGNEYSMTFELNICGDGLALQEAQNYVRKLGLTGIFFSGHIMGLDKRKAFEMAHIFIFPSYSEGMPNAVLEAMGFGLPVICTPVGGLVDFFQDKMHGAVVPIGDAKKIYESTLRLCSDLEELQRMAMRNFEFASWRFRSDQVAKRMNTIFQETLR